MSNADKLPLEGRTVVITRALEQSRELMEQLQKMGAEVLLLPAVSFAPPNDWGPMDAGIRALGTFDWVILTSQNAVRFFCARCRELGVETSGSNGPMFAAVGPATARVAEAEGLRVSRVATRFRGATLAQDMAEDVAGKRVLLPRSDRAQANLPEALRAAGAHVTDVVAYRTLAAPGDAAVQERIRRGAVDAITFASPSAFHHLAEELGLEELQSIAGRVALAAIGPATAQAIRGGGLPVSIEAAESTSEGLAAAIAEFFQKQGARVP